MSVERTDGGAKATGFQLGSLANDLVVTDHLIGLGIELQRAKVGRLNGTIVADRTNLSALLAGPLARGGIELIEYL